MMEESFLLAIKSKTSTLDKCFKKYALFVKSIENNVPLEECQLNYTKFLDDLDEVTLATRKLGFVVNANLLDINAKERLLEKLSHELETLHTELTSLNQKLTEAEIIKQNNEVYQQMLQKVDKYETFEKTQSNIELCNNSLEVLEKERQDIMRKIQIRENQFKEALLSLEALTNAISDEDLNSVIPNESIEMDTEH